MNQLIEILSVNKETTNSEVGVSRIPRESLVFSISITISVFLKAFAFKMFIFKTYHYPEFLVAYECLKIIMRNSPGISDPIYIHTKLIKKLTYQN